MRRKAYLNKEGLVMLLLYQRGGSLLLCLDSRFLGLALLGLHVFGAMANHARSMQDIEARSKIAHDQLQEKYSHTQLRVNNGQNK